MNALGLNEGLMFRQPYESGYATLRRYLSVNPGMLLSDIADLFVVSRDPYWPTLKRNLYAKAHRIWMNEKDIDLSFRRQCPACAQHLYHSRIYALPWLTNCPIHHCEFTAHCPRCQRPWPSPVEMVQRDCPGCSALSFQPLKDCKVPLDYRPIADIHAFLRRPEVNYSLGIGHGYLMAKNEMAGLVRTSPWWHEIPESHPMFPACQAHRNPILLSSTIKSLHIKCSPVNYRIATLIPVHRKVSSRYMGVREQRCLDITKTSQRRLGADYEVMKYIISWIAQHTNGHQIHISNYRNMGTSDFIDGPEPCPYCMALSIWFFLAAGKKYGHYYSSNINHYPFWADFEYVPLYNSGEPYLVVGQVEKYFMGDDLSLWFYRRGLEVMFLQILGSMFRWHERVQQYHEGKRPKDYLYAHKEPRVLNAQLCSIALSGKHFTYYYDGERPLSQYTPPSRIEHVSDKCRRYHVHHAHEPMVICDLDYKVPQAGFTYDVFLGLHQQFREFLTKEFWR